MARRRASAPVWTRRATSTTSPTCRRELVRNAGVGQAEGLKVVCAVRGAGCRRQRGVIKAITGPQPRVCRVTRPTRPLGSGAHPVGISSATWPTRPPPADGAVRPLWYNRAGVGG